MKKCHNSNNYSSIFEQVCSRSGDITGIVVWPAFMGQIKVILDYWQKEIEVYHYPEGALIPRQPIILIHVFSGAKLTKRIHFRDIRDNYFFTFT